MFQLLAFQAPHQHVRHLFCHGTHLTRVTCCCCCGAVLAATVLRHSHLKPPRVCVRADTHRVEKCPLRRKPMLQRQGEGAGCPRVFGWFTWSTQTKNSKPIQTLSFASLPSKVRVKGHLLQTCHLHEPRCPRKRFLAKRHLRVGKCPRANRQREHKSAVQPPLGTPGGGFMHEALT